MHEWSALGAHELSRAEVGEDIPDFVRASRDGPGAVNVGHPLTLRDDTMTEQDAVKYGLERDRCATGRESDPECHPVRQSSAAPDWQTADRCRRGR